MPNEAPPFSEIEVPARSEECSPQPVSVEQLLNQCRELITETTSQFRDVGDLACMEFELAVTTSKWWILAMVMLCTSSILAFTFIVSAAVLLFIDSGPAAVVMLICGAVNTVLACILLVAVRSLSRKMVFRNLRQLLAKAKPGSNVET
ncbi:MAG: hypothetical protein R3E64_10965 [Halioglobus sp.]